MLGYHPETGEELLPVTPEIVDRWKAQQAQASKKPPAPVDPDTYPFFDPKTGRPNIWHSPGESGALEFFDGPGFHPRTGKALTEITRDFADKRLRERADRLEREEQERADRLLREEKERVDHGKAQQAKPPAPVDPDTYPFFDLKTGRPNIWHSPGENGALEFFDGPGFHPRTGKALTEITRDFADKRLRERADRLAREEKERADLLQRQEKERADRQYSKQNATQCYIIQRGARAPVIYRDNRPGMDPETGRECRLVTTGLIERLKEYAEGKRPGRIKARPPEFFDPRTSEPIVWYVDHGGAIEIFDLLGYHPETSEELLPVTPEIVDRWKAQQAQFARSHPPRGPRHLSVFRRKDGTTEHLALSRGEWRARIL